MLACRTRFIYNVNLSITSSAFRVAASVPGFLAGFLKKRDADRRASVCAAFRPEDLVVDGEAYDEWLTQPAEALRHD